MSLLNSPRRQEVAESFFCSWSFESWILLFDVRTDFTLLTRRNFVLSSFIMYRPLFPYLYYLNKEYSEFLKMLPFKCRMMVPSLLSVQFGIWWRSWWFNYCAAAFQINDWILDLLDNQRPSEFHCFWGHAQLWQVKRRKKDNWLLAKIL